MNSTTKITAPEPTEALIGYILARFHQVHREELVQLIPLAQKVEMVHGDDPQAPQGLAQALETLHREMEDHMAKEERILFPAMLAGGMPGIAHPIAVMRADHDDHAANIAYIRRATANLTPPDHACGSWRALYAGTAKLLDDLVAHIALENDTLFPRFERG